MWRVVSSVKKIKMKLMKPRCAVNGIDVFFEFDYTYKKWLGENGEIQAGHEKSVFFVLTSWYKSSGALCIERTNKNHKIIILANSLEELDFFTSKQVKNVIFCNQNAFINEVKFRVSREGERTHDLVIDAAYCNYKNTMIAKKVKNTLHIGYFKESNPVVPDYGKLANIDEHGKYRRFSRTEVGMLYNKCHVAGIFSPYEGACFASTQYLLCGLPVVSVPSLGGRDVWYDNKNSIVCENNEEDVLHSVHLAKEMLDTGAFDRDEIRNKTIERMQEFRITFKTFLADLVNSHDIDLSLFIRW